MDKLTDAEKQLLERRKKALQNQRERQKRYIDNMKKSDPEYSEKRAKYMREYNAKKRGILQKIEDKVGYIPKTVEIPVVEPANVDLRTRKGRRKVMTNDIRPAFLDRKTELEDSSVDDYIAKLNVLQRRYVGKNIPYEVKNKIISVIKSIETFDKIPEIENEMPWLRDADDTIKSLREKYQKDNSFKGYLTPITVLTSHIRNLSEQYQKYTRVAKVTNELVEAEREKNISKEQDKEKIIDLRDRKKNLENMKKLSNLREKVIYGIYTLMPPRRLETRLLKLTSEKDVKKLEGSKYNFVTMTGPMRFVWNEYKTYKEFGQQVYPVPKELEQIIRLYIESENLKDGHFLLGQKDPRLEIAQSNFGKIIEAVFEKVYGIKRLSSRFIRQSYASGLTNKSFAERKELAKAMGHSIEQNLKYSKHLDKFVDD